MKKFMKACYRILRADSMLELMLAYDEAREFAYHEKYRLMYRSKLYGIFDRRRRWLRMQARIYGAMAHFIEAMTLTVKLTNRVTTKHH